MRRAAATALAAVALVAQAPAAAQPQEAIGARIAASADAAEALQGPLDGEWMLRSASGAALYDFQLVDKPGGEGGLEGVWRDLRKPAIPGAVGVVERFSYDGRRLSLSFKDGGEPVTVRLRRSRERWRGEMTSGGRAAKVVLARR
ncbi:MAG: hypothetical protein ACREEW_13315 [Caulobacteraceae bacterium]